MKTLYRTGHDVRRATRAASILAGLLLLMLVAIPAFAQVGGVFDLSWNTVDGGGGTFSTGGAYSIGGTAGQPDAGSMSGGAYGVQGGFWGASVAAPVLVGHVTWQGRTAQPSVRQQLPITLTLKLGATSTDYPAQITDVSGFFTVTLAGLPSGTYGWRVKDPKYLASSGTVALAGANTTQVEMGTMRAGDANDTNIVNAQDFTILKATFGKTQGEPGYDDRADFTGDSVVNALDFNLVKNNFGFGGAPPLAP